MDFAVLVARATIAERWGFPEDRDVWGGLSNHVEVDCHCCCGGDRGSDNMVNVVGEEQGEEQGQERQEAKELLVWWVNSKGHPVSFLLC